jgi:hypothetical protein
MRDPAVADNQPIIVALSLLHGTLTVPTSRAAYFTTSPSRCRVRTSGSAKRATYGVHRQLKLM